MSIGQAGPMPPGRGRGGTVTLRLRRMQTNFRKQSIPVRLWVYVGFLGVYSCVAAAKEFTPLRDFADVPANMHALVGLILSLLLVFRTNTAYERWWEGRKLWGQLLNDSRSLVMKVKHLVKTSRQEMHAFVQLVASLGYALKDHLRGPVALQSLLGFERHAARPRHVPVYLISLIWERIGRWKEQDQLDMFTAQMLDREATSFADIVGGCDRIRSTPLPVSYRTYMRLCLFLYLLTLPWGLQHEFGLWTVPAVVIVSFFMLGLEMIARAVEDPFGVERDDLPLDDLCDSNEATLNELLDEPGEARPAQER